MSFTFEHFAMEELPSIEPWFDDPGTIRWLGDRTWLYRILEAIARPPGEVFRGAVVLGSEAFTFKHNGTVAGLCVADVYDRWPSLPGAGSPLTIPAETIEASAGIAFVVDPTQRGRGLGRRMVTGLLGVPEFRIVARFKAGVEPENVACIKCLESAGFARTSWNPDSEGMLTFARPGPALFQPRDVGDR